MIKSLIGLGDVHLRNEDFYMTGLKGFSEWFDKKFPDSGKDSTELVLAGDVLNKVLMLPRVGASAIDLFALLHRKASTVYVVLGNHDYGLNKYKVINIKPFLEKENIIVIDDLCEYTTKLGFELLCLPWKYGATHTHVNSFIANLSPKEYDACIAHWELESLYGSDFVDLSKVNAKSFMCGHIHQHSVNSKYLGSILPNNIEEKKDTDPSIVRVLVKDSESGKFKNYDIDIPSFLQLRSIKIDSLTDLNSLEKGENIFYKIFYTKTLSIKDVKDQAKILGINIYSVEATVDKKSDTDLKNDLENIKEYVAQSHEDLLKLYAEKLGLDSNLINLCTQAIQVA